MVRFRVKRTIPGRKMSQKSFTMSYRKPALLDPSPTQRQSCVAVDSLNSKRNYSSSEAKMEVLIPVRNIIYILRLFVLIQWPNYFIAQPVRQKKFRRRYHWCACYVKNITDQLQSLGLQNLPQFNKLQQEQNLIVDFYRVVSV